MDLIINADDFGISKQRDEGILKLLEDEQIFSISVIVNNEYEGSKEKLKLCLKKSNKVISVGLHLNLTEGKPLIETQNRFIRPFFENNKMLGKPTFHNLILEEKLDLSIIKEEIILQITKFINDFNFIPSHVDGHQHVHILPPIAMILSELMEAFSILKTRIPLETLNSENSKKEFYKMIVIQANKSVEIYKQNGIFFSQCFIGINFMSDLFIAEDICKELINFKNKEIKLIELMCHPGYVSKIDPWDEFDSSEFRYQEFENLYNLNKLLPTDIKVSSNFIIPPSNKKILLIGEFTYGTGNNITATRIADIFNKLNYTTIKLNIKYLNDIVKSKDYQKTNLFLSFVSLLISFKPDFIIGINAYRSSILIDALLKYKNDNLNSDLLISSYCFIIAGTDANIFLQREDGYNLMKSTIKNSMGIISFNHEMLQIFKSKLDLQNITSMLIPQSVQVEKDFSQIDDNFKLKCKLELHKLLGIEYDDKNIILLLPSGIRKVKDPMFLLNEFKNIISKNKNVFVLIIGSILDKDLFEKLINEIKAFASNIYIKSQISFNDFTNIMIGSDININSSISEGQSNCIMESMLIGVPVIARKNDGNNSLIKHNYTGLLYDTPEEFTLCLNTLLNDKEKKHNLINLAYKFIKTEFSHEKETENYLNFLNLIESKIKKIDSLIDYPIQIISPKIHPFSTENNLLFYEGLENWFNNISLEGSINVMDMGCGYGIFSLIFVVLLKKYNEKHNLIIENLVLVDNDSFCLFNSQRNISKNAYIKNIVLVENNLLEDFSKKCDILFDVILVNLPQSPGKTCFRNDKYGGPTGVELYINFFNSILQYTRPNFQILCLHISLSNPFLLEKTFLTLKIHQNILKIQNRTVFKEDVNLLQDDLFMYWLSLKEKNEMLFETEDNIIKYQVWFKCVKFQN